MKSFVSQLPVHLAYLELGEYSGNAWLLAETAVELVLFGGRLILAHNRILLCARIKRPPKRTSSTAVSASSQALPLYSPSSRYARCTGSWLTKLFILWARARSW